VIPPVPSAIPHRANWEDLRYVLAVAQGGSVAAAARTLSVNHTTVLRRLAACEARLGVRLFDRLPTGYALTPVGAAVIAPLRDVDAAIHDIERRIAGADLRLSGIVRLATTDTLMATVLPYALARVRRRYPGIGLEISTANAFAILTRREADIAVRPTANPPEGLIGRRIASVGFAIYAAPAYLDATDILRPLEAHDWIGPDETLRDVALARWMRGRLPGLEPHVRADSLVSMSDLASAGLGIAVLPCYLGDASPGLRRVPGQDRLDLGTALWLLTHEDLRHVPRIAAVIDALGDALRSAASLLEGAAR
jgi:DNA-binding transcriptional LysR family regulator